MMGVSELMRPPVRQYNDDGEPMAYKVPFAMDNYEGEKKNKTFWVKVNEEKKEKVCLPPSLVMTDDRNHPFSQTVIGIQGFMWAQVMAELRERCRKFNRGLLFTSLQHQAYTPKNFLRTQCCFVVNTGRLFGYGEFENIEQDNEETTQFLLEELLNHGTDWLKFQQTIKEMCRDWFNREVRERVHNHLLKMDIPFFPLVTHWRTVPTADRFWRFMNPTRKNMCLCNNMWNMTSFRNSNYWSAKNRHCKNHSPFYLTPNEMEMFLEVL